MTRFLFILLAFLLGCAGPRHTFIQSESGQPEVGLILSLADFHFDPFYDPTLFGALVESPPSDWAGIFQRSQVSGYGQYGKDSNYSLLVSALRYAVLAAPRADLILLAGDWLAHGFSNSYYQYAGNRDPRGLHEFIDKTIAFLTQQLREQFPNTPIVPVLGNEDSYCGDYRLRPAGEFLRRTADTWKVLVHNGSNERAFLETFPRGGFYALSVPGMPKHRLVVLNTVFFSADYRNQCGDSKDDPARDQLRWLAGQLKDAATNGDKVWLLYHIPYGIDPYNTGIAMDASKTDSIVSLWQVDYTEKFLALLQEYHETIRLMLAGHTHMDYFRLGSNGERGPSSAFLLVTPGISPIFGNNPGLHVLSYDRKLFSLIDYTAYRLDLTGASGEWKEEYRFSRTYGFFPVTAATLRALSHSLKEDARTRATYIDYYNVAGDPAMPQITEATWSLYWCSIGNLTAAAFRSCVENLSRQ
ncbi:MAG: metallophosphoesterase [Candidatus Binatia bacterium]